VKLHIFVDAGSVEVFANDGERVITCLVFPSADSRGVEFFQSEKDAKISSVQAWTLKSVWQ
jgi:sucrose-6-phosphate hydrolase SacC (GH32 family)